MNATQLKHPTIQAKTFAAMQNARLSSLRGNGGQTYVYSKAGKPLFRVTHKRGVSGGFSFFRGNKDLTETVLNVLKALA